MKPTDDTRRPGPLPDPLPPAGRTPSSDAVDPAGSAPICVPVRHPAHAAHVAHNAEPTRGPRPGDHPLGLSPPAGHSPADWLRPADDLANWAAIAVEGFDFCASERGAVRRLIDVLRAMVPAATHNPRALSAISRLLLGLERLPYSTPGVSVRLTVIQRPTTSPGEDTRRTPMPISESCQQILRVHLAARQFVLTHIARPSAPAATAHQTDAGLPPVGEARIIATPKLIVSVPISSDTRWTTPPASCAQWGGGRWESIDRFTERLAWVWHRSHCTMDIVDDQESVASGVNWDIDRDQAQHDPWIRAFGHDNALWMHDRIAQPGSRRSAAGRENDGGGRDDGQPKREDSPEAPPSPD
jgi:hypothetical protein